MAIITGTLATVEATDVPAISGTVVTPGIRELQSQAFDIRNAFFKLVTADPFFANYTKRKTKMLPVQQNLLPYLGIYLIDEVMGPDGDANAGCVRFTHTARIGFSAVAINNDQDVLEQTIDQAFLKIMSILWTDEYLMNVLQKLLPANKQNPEGVMIESIIRGTRRFVFGSASFNNEMPLGELQYDVSVIYRTEWYPNIVDMLDEIDVKTGLKPGDTQTQMDQRQQVAVVYDFIGAAGGPPRLQTAGNKLRRPWLLARDQNKRRIDNG
jgi:hypothetical protein